jgi:EAL domain-containing protein (putative c-di-GMP-specific phosphodiesterase class I)/GGDEF domain-containing protein
LTLDDIFPPESFALFYEVARPELVRRGSWSGDVAVRAGSAAVQLHVSVTMKRGPGGENRGMVFVGRVLANAEPATSDVVEGEERAVFAPDFHVARAGELCAVVVYDFSDAAAAAQEHGHDIVDQIMRAMVARLTRVMDASDSVGGFSGHRLALLMPQIRSRRAALRKAQFIEEELTEPPVETRVGPISLAMTYAVTFGTAGDDPAELVRGAASRQSGSDTKSGRRSHDSASEEAGAQTASIDELRIAFSQGEVKAYAQAVIDPRTRLLTGYRGLPQWHHRTRGVVGPSTIAEISTDTALAPVVDLFIARETAALLVLVSRDTALDQYTSASTRLILDLHTEQHFDEIAAANFLTMQQLHLTVDAGTVSAASQSLRDALRSLADADLSLVLADLVDPRVDLDDVLRLGFRSLELSRQLVKDVATDQARRDVLSDLVERAHRADLLVAAYGVSDEQEHDTVLQLRCDLATGDFYAPAQLIETIADE